MNDEPLCGACGSDDFAGYAQFFDDTVRSELWPLCEECYQFVMDVAHDLLALGAVTS